MSEQAAGELADRLLLAHRRLADEILPDEEKATLARRLIAIAEESKRDLGRAATRLDRLLSDLDDGRGGPESDAPGARQG